MNTPPANPFWSKKPEEIFDNLNCSASGLSSSEVAKRLKTFGKNALVSEKKNMVLRLLVRQFTTPVIVILIGADILSMALGDPADAIIILIVVLVSGLLGFFQEKGAMDAVSKLKDLIKSNAKVLRDGKIQSISTDEIVPGDIVSLGAGDRIPGDGLILESTDLYVGEAALTGESFPVEKSPGTVPAEATISQRTNCLFMGTNVHSGQCRLLIVNTAKNTEFGQISQGLNTRTPENEFSAGIRKFGYLLAEITGILVIIIFAFNVYFHKPVLDSILFALALSVGLTPQLLPAIISVNLAKGTRRMAKKNVIVKRLESIENFGSMNVLCSDKTGTLTEGTIHLDGCFDLQGNKSDRITKYAYLNAMLETGFSNPIDDSLKALTGIVDVSTVKKTDEVPYDFIRKRLTIAFEENAAQTMVSKGALQKVMEVCTLCDDGTGKIVPMASMNDKIMAMYTEYSQKGLRTLGLAVKTVPGGKDIKAEDEKEMTFLGILTFEDILKEGIGATIKELNDVGIRLKVITGDNRLIAKNICGQLGLNTNTIITGSDLNTMRDEALVAQINHIDIFAEIEPNQKERIILACKKAGNVTGYMGDGINDAVALHAADVGISVQDGVDVAKEAADIVLMEKDLHVLTNGVKEGRITFANTLKYIFMATSANFGNMFSMAGASLFMKVLPLLPKQILFMNLLTDLPELTIASDSVDDDWISQPRRWNLSFIKKFMVIFGLISSIFDYATFFVLLVLLKLHPLVSNDHDSKLFRTGWFLESVISASFIVLVVRTRNSVFKSRPSRYLLGATLLTMVITCILPFSTLADMFEFLPYSLSFFGAMIGMVILYGVTAEIAKRIFYKYVKM